MSSIGLSARPGRQRWVIIFWMFVISAVSYLDRNNLSIAASAIKDSFHLSDKQLGVVFSAFVLGYALCQPFAGRIADRFGPHRTINVAILWWSLFTALTALVPPGLPYSLALLVGVRCLLGIGESVIFPAGNRLVAAWIPKQERGLANGLIFAGVGIGGGVAPPLVTWIVVTQGWPWAFYVSAIIGLAVGAFWFLLVRDEPAQHLRVGTAERDYIAAGLPANVRTDASPVHWWRIVADRQVAMLTASYFCFGYVAYIFFSWFFLYLSKVRGLELKSSAILATLPFIAMTLGSAIGGSISDRLTRRYGDRVGRCYVAAAAMLLASLFVAMATQVSDARLAAIVLAGGAGSLYAAQSAFWTLSAGIGGRSAGTLSGIMNMGGQIGGVVVASLTPILADTFGWTASFLFAGGLCGLGGIVWFAIDPHHQLRDPN